MQCGTPSIISKQSGCGEILDKGHQDRLLGHSCNGRMPFILSAPIPLSSNICREEGKKEVDGITWEKVGLKSAPSTRDVLRNYGK